MPISHQTLLEAFGKLGEDGTSLWALKRMGERSAVRLAVMKATEQGLLEFPTPFVAHLEVPAGGHFVLVCSVDRQRVKFLDGTTLEAKSFELMIGRLERCRLGSR